MSVISTILGTPLGYILFFCYRWTASYGAAIILFTLVSKLILFPVSLLVQKNSIKMVKLTPELSRIKERFAGDKEKIADEEHYSPALGCLPMLLQIPLVLGLISVIYNPLQHLLHMDSQTIALLIEKAQEVLNTQNLGSSPQMRAISLIANPETVSYFLDIQGISPVLIDQILSLNLNFFGLNLAEIPTLALSAILLIPILSGLSALALCIYQNRANVLQREQGAKSQLGMTIFLTAFSLYFTFIVPAGVGIYWMASNLLGIVQLFILNRVYDPNQFIDYANREKPLSPEERKMRTQEKKDLANREKADVKRFFADDNWEKQLVFYSEKNGFYKYFDSVIQYILTHSDVVIHYITGDPKDKIFDRKDRRIRPYYISDDSLASVFLKIDADILVMTMPDLNQFHLKRSMARKNMEYIYMFHYPLSTTMVLRKGALDHYDTIFCVGAFQIDEIRQTEALYGLPEKNLVLTGYGFLETLSREYEAMQKTVRERPKVLIAPSWQTDNLLDFCIEPLLNSLIGHGFDVVVRPHPEYVKRFCPRMNAIVDIYRDYTGGDLSFELDFTDSSSIYDSDVVISDWSGTAYEFAFVTKKPAVFVDTPPKVNNPEYDQIAAAPSELTLRDQIGIRVNPDDFSELAERVRALIDAKDAYRAQIEAILTRTIANFGSSGEVGGKYITDRLATSARSQTARQRP